MAEIEIIWYHGDNEFGVDPEAGELYWNKKKILTEQKITLSRLVSVAIAFGAGATVLLAVFAFLTYFWPPAG